MQTPTTMEQSYNSIGKMQIEGNTLYIGGTFHQMMPFDNKLTHVGGATCLLRHWTRTHWKHNGQPKAALTKVTETPNISTRTSQV